MHPDRRPENERQIASLMEHFSQAYRKHGPEVLKYLTSSGLQSADAQDVLQNSFLAMWELRSRIDDTGNLAPLWFTIARHKMFDFYRKSRRALSFSSEQDLIAEPAASIHELDRNYLRHRIAEALRLLPENVVEAYRLTSISGLPVREVAGMLGLSESDVKSKVFRARKKLMEALADLKNFQKN